MAAKSNLASQLADKTTGQKIGILAGVVAVLGLLYWQFFYSSLDEELTSAKSAYTRLERENQSLKQREREWEQMVQGKEEIDQMLKKNRVSLPSSADLASFIGILQRQASAAGVTFKNWKRVKEEKAGSYVKVPVAVEVSGSFYQLMKYYKLLYETKRIITVENFSLKRAKSDRPDEVPLEATFRATTFRSADAPGGNARPGAAAKKQHDLVEKAKAAKEQREDAVESAIGEKTDDDDGAAPGDSGKSGVDRLKAPATGGL